MATRRDAAPDDDESARRQRPRRARPSAEAEPVRSRRSGSGDGEQRRSRRSESAEAEAEPVRARRSGDGEQRRSRHSESADDESTRPHRRTGSGDQGETNGRTLHAGQIARAALEQVALLTNRDPEGVTSFRRDGDGWVVGVEMVESRRIPDTTDILAVYEVDLDATGELVAYRRTQRYLRGRGDQR